MRAFTVSLRLTHPEPRGRSVPLDLLVDTTPAYVLLRASVVAELGIPAVDEWPPNPAADDRLVYRVGEVRLRLDGRELRTLFVANPDDPRSLAAFTIETSVPIVAGAGAQTSPILAHQ